MERVKFVMKGGVIFRNRCEIAARGGMPDVRPRADKCEQSRLKISCLRARPAYFLFDDSQVFIVRKRAGIFIPTNFPLPFVTMPVIITSWPTWFFILRAVGWNQP